MKTDNSLTLSEPPSVELAGGRQESPPLAKTCFGIRKKKITHDGVMRPTKLAELILKTKTSYSAEGSRSHVTVIKSDVFVSTMTLILIQSERPIFVLRNLVFCLVRAGLRALVALPSNCLRCRRHGSVSQIPRLTEGSEKQAPKGMSIR